jgi:hypothetical protein
VTSSDDEERFEAIGSDRDSQTVENIRCRARDRPFSQSFFLFSRFLESDLHLPRRLESAGLETRDVEHFSMTFLVRDAPKSVRRCLESDFSPICSRDVTRALPRRPRETRVGFININVINMKKAADSIKRPGGHGWRLTKIKQLAETRRADISRLRGSLSLPLAFCF